MEAWQEGSYGRIAELVPVSYLWGLREHTRQRAGTPGHGRAWSEEPENWDELKESIRAEGIREPLILDYNPYTGYALLSEGNHRLAIAKELGISCVPVRAYRVVSRGVPGDGDSRYRPVAGGATWPKGEYVPADLKPSQVLPVEVVGKCRVPG